MRFLNADKALIFRIVHIKNLPWILKNGLHCQESALQDPSFRCIGNREIITKRASWPVPLPPRGTLGDYVPFYFTPCSIMLFNIKTGYNGVRQFPMDEIVTLVSDLRTVSRAGIKFLFTERHAKLATAVFSSDINQLGSLVDWKLLRSCDFRNDPRNPEKKERYQAEALIHKLLPVEQLMAIGCCSDDVKLQIDAELQMRQIQHITVKIRPKWFFQ